MIYSIGSDDTMGADLHKPDWYQPARPSCNERCNIKESYLLHGLIRLLLYCKLTWALVIKLISIETGGPRPPSIILFTRCFECRWPCIPKCEEGHGSRESRRDSRYPIERVGERIREEYDVESRRSSEWIIELFFTMADHHALGKICCKPGFPSLIFMAAIPFQRTLSPYPPRIISRRSQGDGRLCLCVITFPIWN